MAAINQADNPYVGPRTFQPEERAKFFGRGREARELTSLIVSNRLVLFYSPSGAGKSSLLNTMIGPMLAEAGFEILPTGRVSGYSGDQATAANIYVYNLLLSLHQSDAMSADFSRLTIAQFLDNLVRHSDGACYYDPDHVYPPDTQFKPRVLVIDQFEELATTNAPLWPQRANFFRQLAEAMRLDEQLWVVLTLREDFVARFDPYLHLTPTRLRHRYYMERLTRAAALEAIRMPVAEIRPFEPDALELLADNLMRLRAADGQEGEQLAQFVEPVQLQAVCYQMWEELRQRPGATITADDVTRFANVDKALTKFYEEMIRQTVGATAVSEVELREWFEKELITEAGTRNMVYRGEEMTGGLPTDVADYVRGQFILSEVVRPGGMWYELVHDRFVSPILASNTGWRQNRPLIQLAMEWDKNGRPEERLLSGEQLQQFDGEDVQGLGPLVADYIAASAQRQKRVDRELRDKEHERLQTKAMTRVLGCVTWIMIIASVFAAYSWFNATQATERAEQAQSSSQLALATAVSAQEAAVIAQETAGFNATVAVLQSTRASEARGTLESEVNNRIESEATLLAMAANSQALQATANAQRVQAEQTRDALMLTAFPNVRPTIPLAQTPTPNWNATATVQYEELQFRQSEATAAANIWQLSQLPLPPVPSAPNAVILDVPYRSQWDDDANLLVADDGPTALAMLLNAGDVEITPNEISQRLPSTARGEWVAPSDLIQLSRAIGFPLSLDRPANADAALAALRRSIDQVGPFLAVVKYEPWQRATGNSYSSAHYVVVVGYDDQSIYFHDPLFGLWMPRNEGAYVALPINLFMAGWGGFELWDGESNYTMLFWLR